MADREQVVPVLLQLPISNLDAEWVKSIWESEFTEIPELEGGVSEDLQDTARLVGTLSDLQTTLHGWTDDQEQAGLWTVLVENDISLKNLIALLTYLIDAGSKHSSLFAQKQLALFAACSYLKLIVVPGSSAFKVFHPQLYENSVDLLKQLNKQAHHAAPSKRKRSSLSSQHSQSRKNKSMKRGRNAEPLFEDDDDNDDVEEELSPHQVLGFSKLLKCLLKDVVKLLDVFSLRQSETSSHKTVQILSQLSRIEGEKFNGSFDLDSIQVERLSVTGLAYRGLILLCQPLHGNVIAILNAVCKTLLPGLLMLVGENKVAAQTIPNSLSSVRDHAVKFVCYLMEKCGERAHPSVRTLLQHMCTKVPDRTEYRAKVSEAVVTILQCLPAEPYGKMVEWFYRLSRNSKMNNRGFALDVVTLLLQGKKKSDLANLPAELAPYLEHRYLVSMIVARCSDSAPTVRARAISCFCQCLASKDTLIVDTLRDIVTPRQRAGRHPNAPRLIHTPVNSGQTSDADTVVTEPSITPADQTVVGPPPDPEGAIQTPATNNGPPGAEQTPFLSVNLTPGFNPNLVDDDGVISMLRRRAQDEKVNVRKSALQAIESFIRFEGASYRKEDIEVLKERCRDPSLTVRKQAMQSLTDLLLDMSHDEHLQRMWLDGVLPLVIDRETSLQEKCFETLEGIVLNNIVPFQKSQGSQYELVWGLLGIMAKYECVDLRRYLQKACRHWLRLGKFKVGMVSSLETHINTINDQGAWMLLAEVASGSSKINHNQVLEYWEKNANRTDGCDFGTLQRVLTVLSCVCKKLLTEPRNNLIADLKDRLKRFDSPPEIIAVTIHTLSKLCEAAAAEEGRQSDKDEWCEDLLQACDQYLSRIVLEEGDPEDETLVMCHLFTLGEISQLCPAKTPKRVFLLVQSLIAAPCLSTSQSTSQDSLSSSQPSQASQPLSQFRGSSNMSSRIRAHAFITLGKLCLQNEDLAKKCVAALARELETSNDPAVRNNVVIIMCDLCVRYTTTADRYVCNIASCLKDPAALIRKQTLTLLTRLLQEDFVKWKGVLFFRYISTLLDESEEIKSFAEFCLIHMLLQRHPTMFFQHFVECVFHFNGYDNHTVYNKFQQSVRDKQMFSLKGKDNSKSRMRLYLFMLEHMTDEHRFKVTAKICQEVLGAVVDGVMPLDEDSSALMQDALGILSSKEIKLSSLRSKPQEDVAGDEQEMAAVVMAHAKKTIITQVVKRNVIENIVPIVVSLKHMLEKHRSPVLKDLMFYLQELMRDYKTEVKEILSTDRQLANEIEFDLRKFEEQQMEAEKQSNTIQQATPGPSSAAGSPRPPSIQGSPSGRPKADDLIGKSPVKDAGHSGSQKTGSPFSSPKSVRQTSPMTSPGQATSPSSNDSFSRDSSLTTLAILNSAKKAFERNQQLKSVPNSPLAKLRRRQSVAIENARKNSLLSDPEDSSPSETEKESEASRVKTPKRVINRKMTRAISTPSNALSNITFHMDQNVTLVPPSPIPTSLPIRVYGDMSDDTGEPSTPSKKQNKENGNKEKQVVFMFSPDKPLPKPRQWKVKTPAQVQTKMQVLSETDSESSISVFTDHDNSASSSSKPKSRLTNSATSESSTSIAKSRPVRRASRSRKT